MPRRRAARSARSARSRGSDTAVFLVDCILQNEYNKVVPDAQRPAHVRPSARSRAWPQAHPASTTDDVRRPYACPRAVWHRPHDYMGARPQPPCRADDLGARRGRAAAGRCGDGGARHRLRRGAGDAVLALSRRDGGKRSARWRQAGEEPVVPPRRRLRRETAETCAVSESERDKSASGWAVGTLGGGGLRGSRPIGTRTIPCGRSEQRPTRTA